MTTIQNHLNLAPRIERSASRESAPLLHYTANDDTEQAMWKTLAGFSGGSLMMGLMLNTAVYMLVHHMARLTEHLHEYVAGWVFFFGLTFVGTSLLLVALKAREDRSPMPLHSKHWIVSLVTGAFFALVVFGPGLVAERGLSLNSPTAIAAWVAVLVVPIAASFWLVTRERTRNVLARMIG